MAFINCSSVLLGFVRAEIGKLVIQGTDVGCVLLQLVLYCSKSLVRVIMRLLSAPHMFLLQGIGKVSPSPIPSLLSLVSFSESRTSVSVFCLNLKHNSFSLPEKSNQTKAVLNIYQIS